MTDRFEEEVPVGILVEIPNFTGSVVLRAERVVNAIEVLQKAGFVLILLPAGAAARVEKSGRRRWWRRPE